MKLPFDIRMLRFRPDVVVASLATNIFALALPLVILHVFDRVIPNRNYETMAILAGGLLAVAVLDFAVRSARSRIVAVAGTRFLLSTHWHACISVLHPGVDIRHLRDEELQDRFAAIARMQKHYGGEMTTALLDIPFIVIFLAVMVLISPALGIGAIALAAASLSVVLLHRRQIIALGHRRQERGRRRYSFLTETLERIEMIKALGLEADMQRRYERLMSTSAAITRDLSGRVSFTQGVTGTISLVSPVIMAGLGSFLVIDGQMTMGGLAAGVLLSNRIIQPTLRIEALIAGERDIRPAVEEVDQLVDAPMRLSGRAPLRAIEEIRLENVCWTPGLGKANVIDGVSLTLRRGETISISGKDGSGRSTLLSLISGHNVATAGEVRINGEPIGSFDPMALSQRISYLSSDYTLLEGTILDNMTAFEPDANREAAFELARELGIDGFISGLPNGYTTQVAARTAGTLPRSVHDGVLLISELVSKPDIILFDEASLGLDHRTDAALIKLLEKLKRETILILVTYRPSLRAIADRQFTIAGGRLSEQAPADAAVQGAASGVGAGGEMAG